MAKRDVFLIGGKKMDLWQFVPVPSDNPFLQVPPPLGMFQATDYCLLLVYFSGV